MQFELFAKPGDRWDVNQVADRVPDIAERLAAALRETLASDDPSSLSPLDSELTEPID